MSVMSIDELTRDSFELTSGFAVLLGADNTILLHSQRIGELVSGGDAVGIPFHQLVHPHDTDQLNDLVRRARAVPATTLHGSFRTHYGRRLAWRARAYTNAYVMLCNEQLGALTYHDVVETLKTVRGMTIFIIDKNAAVMDGGGLICDTTGLAHKEMTTAHATELLRSLGFRNMQPHIDRVLAGEPADIVVYRHATRIYNIHFAPIVAASGTPAAAAIFIYDLSKHNASIHRDIQSANRYKQLVEQQQELIVVFREDKHIIYVNEALCRFFGVKRNVLQGSTIPTDVLPPSALRTFKSKASATTPASPYFTIEHPIQLTGNDRRWISWTCRAVFHPYTPVIMEYHAVGRDITQRKNAEFQQIISEQRLQLAVDGAQLAMWDWDIANSNFAYSDGWSILLGYTLSEFDSIANAWESLAHPEDRLNVYRAMWDHLLGRTAMIHSNHRLRGKNGQYFWVTMSGRVMKRDKKGRPLRVSGILMNIHTQYVAADALQKQHTRLRNIIEITAQPHDTLEAQIHKLLSTSTELLGMQVGVVTRVIGESLIYRYVHAPDYPELKADRRFDLSVSFCHETCQTTEVYTINDAEAIGHISFTDHGFRAYIGVTLMVNAQVFGTLVFMSKEANTQRFSASDADYVKLLGRWVSTALERQHANETLAAQEALFRDIVNNANDIVYRVDREGYYTYVNPQGTALTGYSLAELRQLDYKALIPEIEHERVANFFKTQYRNQIEQTYIEVPIVARDGRRYWLGNSIRLLIVDGNSVGFQGIARDITQQHQTALEREQLIYELDSFAETVAHDLKNPIHTITGYAALAAESKSLDDETRLILDRIQRVGEQMNGIVVELLKLAELRSNAVDFEPLDVRQIVQNTLERLNFLVRQTEARITVAETFAHTAGYAPWIEEVFANYISNALRYGGSPPTIEIGSKVLHNDQVRYYVRDHGPGIAADVVPKLFEPRQIKSQHADSTGLGLSIVRRIIERHGGTVGVESEMGKGSTFYFNLPR